MAPGQPVSLCRARHGIQTFLIFCACSLVIPKKELLYVFHCFVCKRMGNVDLVNVQVCIGSVALVEINPLRRCIKKYHARVKTWLLAALPHLLLKGEFFKDEIHLHSPLGNVSNTVMGSRIPLVTLFVISEREPDTKIFLRRISRRATVAVHALE